MGRTGGVGEDEGMDSQRSRRWVRELDSRAVSLSDDTIDARLTLFRLQVQGDEAAGDVNSRDQRGEGGIVVLDPFVDHMDHHVATVRRDRLAALRDLESWRAESTP